MIKIVKTDGGIVGLCENPRYIKLHANGFYVLCNEAIAQGVAVDGTPYNLDGREPMKDCTNGTVVLVPADGGDLICEQGKQQQKIIEQLAAADETAVELYEANIALEEASATLDESIIELYEMMGV